MSKVEQYKKELDEKVNLMKELQKQIQIIDQKGKQVAMECNKLQGKIEALEELEAEKEVPDMPEENKEESPK